MVLVDKNEDNDDSAKNRDSDFYEFVQVKAFRFLKSWSKSATYKWEYLHRLVEFFPRVIDSHMMIAIVTSTATSYIHNFINVFWYFILDVTGFIDFLFLWMGSIKARSVT